MNQARIQSSTQIKVVLTREDEEERLALACPALPCSGLAFTLETGRFVVSATARLSQNAILLNFAIEPLQGSLKRLVLANPDF